MLPFACLLLHRTMGAFLRATFRFTALPTARVRPPRSASCREPTPKPCAEAPGCQDAHDLYNATGHASHMYGVPLILDRTGQARRHCSGPSKSSPHTRSRKMQRASHVSHHGAHVQTMSTTKLEVLELAATRPPSAMIRSEALRGDKRRHYEPCRCKL